MAVSPTECYRRNLSALRVFQPAVAALVDETRIPDGFVPATGRDGSDTFLIPSDNGRREWFGRSSMPRVSAGEIFAGFRSDGLNVSLPGVLTGVEPLVVAGKMPAHTALFVIEADVLQLKLALHVCDYADLIARGRIVFVVGRDDALTSDLCGFFEEHPGYELPVHLLTVPQRTPAEITDMQRAIEHAGEAVTAACAALVTSQVDALRARTFGPLPRRPPVAVLSFDPTPASIEQAGRVHRALVKLEWPHEICVPDAPDKCHVTARLSAIHGVTADLVLVVNGTPGSMRPVLPADLPVASWLMPGTIVQSEKMEQPAENHVVFVSSRALQEEFARATPACGAVELLPTGADDTIFRPGMPATDEGECAYADVAAIADLPDDRPEACGVTLASHIALWHALQTRVQRNADQYRDGSAEEVLDAAQRDSGTHLQDSAIRRHFLDLLQARIAPAALARASIELLIGEGFRVALWGANWPAQENTVDNRHGPIPAQDALNRVFNTVRIVLLPVSSSAAVQIALDALAAGACVICRCPDGSFEEEYPGLADLAPHVPSYRTSGELLDTVRELMPRGDATADPCEKARTLVRSEHTITKRLTAIVDTLRRGQAAGA